jgi:exodeoxyribonuclease 7 small subunit
VILSKELQETLDKAEKTLVKVMQEDGTESELL